MSFIAKNPLTIPKVSKAPSAPIQGARGLFAKEDGWYDIDDSGNARKIISEDDLSAEIPEVIDNLTSTDTTKALSANQGKVLNDGKADKTVSKGGFKGGENAAVNVRTDPVYGQIGGTGAALGKNAKVTSGGAIGENAQTDTGGAVGEGAVSGGGGFAGGKNATTKDLRGGAINAIQLGEGNNGVGRSLNVYNYQLMDAGGNIPLARLSKGIETTPTENSTNLITSGGVYSGIRTYIDEAILGGAW